MEFTLLASLRQRFAELSQQDACPRPCQVYSDLVSDAAQVLTYEQHKLATAKNKEQVAQHQSQERQQFTMYVPPVVTKQCKTQQQHTCQKALHCTQQQRSQKAKRRVPQPKVRLELHHPPDQACPLQPPTPSSRLCVPGTLHTQVATTVAASAQQPVTPCCVAAAQPPTRVYNQLAAPLFHHTSAFTCMPHEHSMAQPTTAPCKLIANIAGCVRAEPQLTWRNMLQTSASMHAVTNLGLGGVQGRHSASLVQLGPELGKARQLRPPNLHAAVSTSRQLMHRFIVRRSAVAHLGVFTTGGAALLHALPCLLPSPRSTLALSKQPAWCLHC